MKLTEQFHVPGEYHAACDRLTTLVQRHSQRVLDAEYWCDEHIAKLQDHTGPSYTYIRDGDYPAFDGVEVYVYSRFKRCVYHRVTHILAAHSDAHDAFHFITDTLNERTIRRIGWHRLRRALFDNPDSPYIPWGVLEQVVDQVNDYYAIHGRFPPAYADLVECPAPNGTLSYAPDTGDYHIHDLTVADGHVMVVLNAPDTRTPESYHDWTEHTIRFPTHARFHEMLAYGDGLGAPTLHASERGYTIDVPVTIPEQAVDTVPERVLAVDLGVKKQATFVVLDHCEDDAHEQVAPPEFIDHPAKGKLLQLKANADGLNDRLAQLRDQGHAHTDRFAHLLSEYRRVRRKERRLRQQIQHDVANQLVWLAIQSGCETIVFESLAGLDSGTTDGVTAWSISSWARGTLLEKVEYRADLVGLAVATVNPWGTSRHCPRCGERGETVKAPNDHTDCRHGGHFHCPACGYECDRDVVGAVNVGRKHLSACRMEAATPAAYTAAGNHASFPSGTCAAVTGTAESVSARSAGVQSATETGSVSGRQTYRSQRRATPPGEGRGDDTGGLPKNYGRKTGWRCPSGSITRSVLTSTTDYDRMLPNPTEN